MAVLIPSIGSCAGRMTSGEKRLAQTMRTKGLDDKVNVRNFHSWCAQQLKAFHVKPPREGGSRAQFHAAQVEAVVRAVSAGQIPTGTMIPNARPSAMPAASCAYRSPGNNACSLMKYRTP